MEPEQLQNLATRWDKTKEMFTTLEKKMCHFLKYPLIT